MHTRTAASLRLNVLLLLPPLLLLATVFLVVAGVAVVVDGAAVAGGAPALTATASDVCVCVDLTGPVQDCCCDYQTVEDINRSLGPVLLELLETTFFRHYKVNLDAGCPFWPDDSQCHLRDCSVQECSEDDVPAGLREKDESVLSAVDFGNQGLPLVKNCQSSEKDFCFSESDAGPDCHYVDLIRNPEAYTGYGGPSAQRIWKTIYQENCFQPSSGDLMDGSFTCTEERVFYRLLSGLQSSISAHLASRYYDREAQAFINNDSLFSQMLGAHESRLKNLYFVYNVVLRAISKVSHYVDSYDLTTGKPAEDAQAASLVHQLTTLTNSCPMTFDESTLFNSSEKLVIKNEFKVHFRNISRIMDCVGCEKCRLWGKVQIQGLGTALKILFSFDDGHSNVDYDLRRNEVVSLFNLMGRLSESISELEAYRLRAQMVFATEAAAAPSPVSSIRILFAFIATILSIAIAAFSLIARSSSIKQTS